MSADDTAISRRDNLDEPIGNEGAAKLLEQDHGEPRLAAIHRLTGQQAVSALVRISVFDPDLFDDAMAYARGEDVRPDAERAT